MMFRDVILAWLYFVLVAGVAYVNCNVHCNPAIWRCRTGYEVFEYNKRSECSQTGGLWNCQNAKTHCICLNPKEICDKVAFYSETKPANPGRKKRQDEGDSPGSTEQGSVNALFAAIGADNFLDLSATGTVSAPSPLPPPPPPPRPPPNPMCSKKYVGDGEACDKHSMCKSVPGGIALCCKYKCVHVHNVPCVRAFWLEKDCHCNNKEWNSLFGDVVEQ